MLKYSVQVKYVVNAYKKQFLYIIHRRSYAKYNKTNEITDIPKRKWKRKIPSMIQEYGYAYKCQKSVPWS